MSNLREQTQTEAYTALVESGYKGTVILPTGVGKSKVGIMALRDLIEQHNSSVLIIVPRVNLKDHWLDEFAKWGVDSTNVTIQCINTAAKDVAMYDVVLVDEAHRSLSTVFRQVYTNLRYKYLICLTATEPRELEYRSKLYEYAPLVYRKTLNDALEMDSVSEFSLYNVGVNLSKDAAAKYNVFNKQFTEGLLGLSSLRNHVPYLRESFASAFDIARYFVKSNVIPTEVFHIYQDLLRYSKAFWSGMTLRKSVLYNNAAKIDAVKQILTKWSTKKWIIFTKTIKMAEQLKEAWPSSRIYHSKLKTAERETVLSDYSEGKFNVLISVDALNEGFNVENVDCGMTVSGSSTELEQIQRLGRCIRKQAGKVALFINLYSIGTQEEKWVRKRTENINNVKWSLLPQFLHML